jgi:hypothetical protein
VAAEGSGVYGMHVVVVVDSSGSMRKADVPGYASRTEAVYESLTRDYVRPQLEAACTGGVELGNIAVTLIEMSDTATVLYKRVALDEKLFAVLEARKHSRAHSHGNYLPALDRVLQELEGDASTQTQLFLLFLSDRAPSDHLAFSCPHGVQVWSETHDGRRMWNGKPAASQWKSG